ncbi:MAG: hypothetical protein ACKOA8_09590, partial [Deltaproteobacteria bacterium]
ALLFKEFSELSEPFGQAPGYSVRRIKQWVNLASKRKTVPFFEELKRVSNLEEVFQVFDSHSRTEKIEMIDL